MTTGKLSAQAVTLAYGDRVIVDGLDFEVPQGELTVIVGPNACGKSTLLKALARTLKPRQGEVQLDGRPILSYRSRQVAKRVGMLPQSPLAPDGIIVRDLVGRGRFPHQRLLRQWSSADQEAVRRALEATGITELAQRPVGELSGGQRQRTWIAMALAQETEFLLLDEPTTFLDIAHQYEVLDLCARLHRDGRTLVVVLHDLNQAARYASHLVVMKDGAIVAAGRPSDVVTAELVHDVFGLACTIIADPETTTPMVVPRAHVL